MPNNQPNIVLIMTDQLHGEHSYGDASNHYIVTDHDKYIWFSQTGKEQYFNLDEDPFELTDRIADTSCQERIDYLRSCLIEALDGREEGYVKDHQLIVGRPPQVLLEKSLLRAGSV